LTLCPPVFDRHVPALDVTGVTQALVKSRETLARQFERCEVEKPDHRHHWLRRARRDRPRRYTSSQRDELPPSHCDRLFHRPLCHARRARRRHAGLGRAGLIQTPPLAALDRDDGFLTISEIATLKLDADWIVLSVCNTAAGGSESAEALSGMARASFYAGTRALLASHWVVSSQTTVRLVTRTFVVARDLARRRSLAGPPQPMGAVRARRGRGQALIAKPDAPPLDARPRNLRRAASVLR
jgi:hypothetical protein